MRLGAMPLSDRIRKIRISKELNQAEFGEALGYAQGTVSRWEKSRGAMIPDKDALKKIAKLQFLYLGECTIHFYNGK